MTSPKKPAYRIELSKSQKVFVADLAAIQAQTEWMMRLTVQHLLEITPDSARLILGSTSIEANSNIWFSIVQTKCLDSRIKELAKVAMSKVKTTSSARNDFLHTLFGTEPPSPLWGAAIFTPSHRPKNKTRNQQAIRVKTQKTVDLSTLKTARDEAASLSIYMACIEAMTSPHPASPIAWRRKFSQLLRHHSL